MASVSGGIISAILPLIAQAFSADVATIEWVLIVYLLTQGGLLLTFGRLGDLHGQRRVYIGGSTVFLLGSCLCGLAPSVVVLIAARIVQAVGGAMLFSSSPAILVRAFPAAQRGRALGMQSTMVYLGLASGPPISGWLADLFGWRSVFVVSIVIGIAALGLSLRYIPSDRPTPRREHFDRTGAVTYLLGLIGVLLALNQGHAWGWTSPLTLGCLAAGFLLLGLFAMVELRSPSPMLDLAMFRRRAFSAPIISAVLNYMSAGTTYFLLPFALIQGRGLSPSEAGLIMASQPIVMAFTASFSGRLSDRTGSRLPSTLGMVLLAIGQFLLSRTDEHTPVGLLVAPLVLVGLGIGLFTSPNGSAVMGAVPAERRGIAGGVLSTARTLGNVLGIGLAGAILSTALADGGEASRSLLNAGVSAALATAALLAALGAIASASRPSRDLPG
jgi:EmrB/QacA subfamily drug resistance transporter